MNSSGIKRGLAATAVSALAVAGLPFLASSASAIPSADQFPANDVVILSQSVGAGAFSAKNDGTNTTVSVVAGGGANVNAVVFQYQTVSNPTWQNIGSAVARGADGLFQTEWSTPPTDVTQIRAVANTSDEDIRIPATNVGAGAGIDTVELASEGSLGVFQEPYTEGTYAATTSELLGVTGTVSQGSAAPTITDASAGTGASDVATLEPTTDTASDNFNAVVDIDGYPYSSGTEANQIALNAATADTDDVEGSTLYVQTIGSITAEPATQEQVDPTNSSITLTVKDTTGKPVAGAQVAVGADTDTDGAGPDTDTDGAETILGYTDGRGQYVDNSQTAASTFVYYVNTTDNDAFEAGTDKSASATVTTYTPVLTTVQIKNLHNRAAFDLDELNDTDDFQINTLDQKGTAFEENLTAGDGRDIEYRYVVDPDADGAATVTSAWIGAETTAGSFTVPALTDALWAGFPGATGDLPDGSYTIEARRPNVGGVGLVNATPATFKAGEAEITWTEGASANAAVESDATLEGTLALADGTPLAGRGINITFTSGREDAVFVDAAGAADADALGLTAAGVTDANGKFSVKVDDPAGPDVVPDNPEDDVINAIAQETATDADSLQGANGANDSAVANDPANAEQEITLHFMTLPAVQSITIGTDDLMGAMAPGQPVDLDVKVFAADGPDVDTNPDQLSDYPVTISVDNEAFLSPNAETTAALTLADGHNATGDLYGYFKNDGTSKTTTTGDAAEAGAVVAIERNSDFDDDGLADVTVTVKAGDVTKTETITFDATNVLNLGESSLERAAGEPAGDVPVGENLDFQLYVHDQFGNLVGDQSATISDDSTVADFDTDGDFGATRTDFTTSGPGIRAFSDAPTVQTLMAKMQPGEVLVDANDDPDFNSRTVTVSSDPINWVAVGKVDPQLVVRGRGGKVDRVKANAISEAAGARATVWVKGKRVGKGVLNSNGNITFRVKDKNGNRKTKYVVKIGATTLTFADQASKRIR